MEENCSIFQASTRLKQHLLSSQTRPCNYRSVEQQWRTVEIQQAALRETCGGIFMIRRGQKDTSSSGVHRKRSCSCTSGARSTTSRTHTCVLRYVMFENSITHDVGAKAKIFRSKTSLDTVEPPNMFCGQIDSVTVTTSDCGQHKLLNNSNEINKLEFTWMHIP